MNMKDHILAAMKEQVENWETLLTSLSEEQLASPEFDLGWSIKDVMNHLWGWQQISLARLEGGIHNSEPVLPDWLVDLGAVWEEDANQTNARMHDLFHTQSWTTIHQNWRNGYLKLIELGAAFSERDLLDGDKYPWLRGYSLAAILIASYEHHQEHYEKLTHWLEVRS